MGPEGKVEFTGGTLYFTPIDGPSDFVYANGLEVIEMDGGIVEFSEVPVYISKIVNQPFEFEGTCEIKFRGLVKLLGFWPAVKWKIGRFFRRY